MLAAPHDPGQTRRRCCHESNQGYGIDYIQATIKLPFQPLDWRFYLLTAQAQDHPYSRVTTLRLDFSFHIRKW